MECAAECERDGIVSSGAKYDTMDTNVYHCNGNSMECSLFGQVYIKCGIIHRMQDLSEI